MNHLLKVWNELVPLLKPKQIMLFLDYDGTLTPIVKHPESARLSSPMKEILEKLNFLEGINVTIVSGRSLEQLKTFVGIPKLLYIGNHGFEIEGPDFQYIHPSAVQAKGVMGEIAKKLQDAFEPIEGVLVENKIFTLSVHYRLVSEDKVDRVRMIFLKALSPFLNQPQVIFTEGKKVLEVRPALGWNKGTAVAWVYGRKLAAAPSQKILPIYIGDDRTDEAALKTMKDYGIGVKVTQDTSGSHANYYLHNSEEVYDFLERMLKLKGNAGEI